MGFMAEVVLPLALAFIMFALGLGLTGDDFARVARRPKDFAAGLLSQIVLLPLVAFTIVSVWPVAPAIALGVMIVAVAPGGVTSNLLTAFARGDVALSISLTAVVSLLSVVTIPLVVVLAYEWFIGREPTREISLLRTGLGVFVLVTVPALLGMAMRRFAPRLAEGMEPVARRISGGLFVVVLLGAILQERANIVPYFAEAGLVTLTLNLTMMALAWMLAVLIGTGRPQRIAISLECGLQNGTLAIAVATLLFGGGPAVIPAATYSLTMFATALIFVWLLRCAGEPGLRRARVRP